MGENTGTIIQVIGPVVDVEFEQGKLPTIYTALTITNPAIDDQADNLVVEVAQHLGDNVVRTIAMDVTDGLTRGQQAKDTGKQIMMPVGEAGLGRVLNVVGDQTLGLTVAHKGSKYAAKLPYILLQQFRCDPGGYAGVGALCEFCGLLYAGGHVQGHGP